MPWNFPFQPDAGIHTSSLMFESLVGLITPVTRQKAGTSLNGAAEPAGGVNAPGATVCAAVIVVFASLSSASFSQLCPVTVLAPTVKAASKRTIDTIHIGLLRVAIRLFISILTFS